MSDLVSGQIGGIAFGKGDAIEIKVHGLAELAERMFLFGREAVKAFAGGIHNEAEMVATYAKGDQGAPVEKGVLRNSIRAPLPKIGRDYVEQIVEAGGAARQYAAAVHEIPEPPAKSVGGRSARHRPPHGKGGAWKYLERPFNLYQTGRLQRVADHCANALGM
jgi:hypothetical protein